MLVCSVICAVVGISQPGGKPMLLSVLITYGGKRSSPCVDIPTKRNPRQCMRLVAHWLLTHGI